MGLTINSYSGGIVSGSGTIADPYSIQMNFYSFNVSFSYSENGTIFYEFSGQGSPYYDNSVEPPVYHGGNAFFAQNLNYVWNDNLPFTGYPSGLSNNDNFSVDITNVNPVVFDIASYPESGGYVWDNTTVSLSVWFVSNIQIPTALIVDVQPAGVISGNSISTQPVIKIVDQDGNLIPTATDVVDVSINFVTGSGSLTGTLSSTAVDGYATFTDLVVTGAGSFYLTFSSGILTPVNSDTLFFTPDPGNPNPPIPVKPKRSYIPASVPTSGDMETNEFAINVADKKGYVRDSNGIVHQVFDGNASGSGTVTSVGLSSTNSTLTISNSPVTTSGTIKIDLSKTSVSAKAYTNADITVDAYGRITAAANGSVGVTSIIAGTGVLVDTATGDVTVTNSLPDQTVSLTDGTGISVTGTYPDFTIATTITQYTDSDARLSLSAGTGISYDNATGIITNDEPDQTVTLTNGTDISITGTYPSFTIAYSGTAGSGTVTKASVVSANGFAGSVATDTTTPAITISTSITGLLKGDGTAIAAATAGTDYVVPSGSITGNAATVTTNADLTGVITSKGNSTSIASQTGTGSKFVVDTSPTLVTPNIGVASGTSLTLSGDLTVNGTTTTIASTTLAVGDKNIVLASASTTDAGADGGGITLKGASDHTWNWIDATDAWTSSDHINLASGKSFYINGTAVLSATALGSGISVTATTNANLTGVITSVGNATSIASQTGTGTKFVMDTSPTLVTPVLGTPSSGDLTNCTFPTLNQNTTGNASTVTTNANLTGPITSSGNATSIGSQTGTGTKFVMDTSPTLITPTIGAATATSLNKITVTAPATGATLTIVEGATLTASATASVSGTNTGDNAVNTLYSGLVSNATHTGDATGSTALTVVAINGVLMSGLATGLLKNTTSTGAPSIAVAGTDYVTPGGALGTPSSGTLTNCTFPTLNQNTTGTAAGLSATLAVTSGGTGQITATAAFDALAPSQTSNSGKYLKTDGTNTSWGTLPSALPVLLFDGVTITSVSVANGSLPVLLFGGVTTVNVTVT